MKRQGGFSGKVGTDTMSDVINLRAERALHAKRSEGVDNSAALPAGRIDNHNRKYNERLIGTDFNATIPVRSSWPFPAWDRCRLPDVGVVDESGTLVSEFQVADSAEGWRDL